MISYILSYPLIFNIIRYIIAGEQRRTKKFVRNNLTKHNVKTVVDIGCGTGDFVEAIPQGISYLGIDFSSRYISYAQKRFEGRKIQFTTQDIRDRNFYFKKKFDAVLLISLLHHLSDRELEELLHIVKKITRKVVIIADIIPDPPGILGKLMVKLDQGKFVRSREEKLILLKKYFIIVKTEEIPSRLAVQFGIVCKI